MRKIKMLKEKLTCIQCEVDRGCLAYMKYMKGEKITASNMGKVVEKCTLISFFCIHTPM